MSRGWVSLAGHQPSTVLTMGMTLAQAMALGWAPTLLTALSCHWGPRACRLTPLSRAPASSAGPRGSEYAGAGCWDQQASGARAGPRQ